jgi:hypothetical protein
MTEIPTTPLTTTFTPHGHFETISLHPRRVTHPGMQQTRHNTPQPIYVARTEL